MDSAAHAGDASIFPRNYGVFLSRSSSDAQWAKQFKTFLKPLIRNKQLRLWIYTDTPTGNEWNLELVQAIERSSVALLLVSAEFLNSDFIMDQELPMLVKQGVRLAPVLVGDCMWKRVPELESVQWLHDPGRDGAGALNRITRRGQRNRRIREICDKLIALTPEARRSRSPSYDPLSLPADSSLSHNRPYPTADGKFAYQPVVDNGYAEGAVQLGLLCAKKGIITGAQAAYQRAINSGDPEWAPAAMLLLGVLLAQQGNTAEARAAYKQAIDSGHPRWAHEAAAKLRGIE